MRLLLDTHALLWWVADDARLSPSASQAIADRNNQKYVSAVSAYEVCQKVRIGRLEPFTSLANSFGELVAAQDFRPLSLSVAHGRQAGLFASKHRDPFDRMLIAQAQLEGLTLVSNETIFDQFGVSRLW